VRKWTGRRVSAVAAASWILATVLTSLVVWRAAAVFNAASSTKVLTPPQVSARLDAATASASSTSAASPSSQTRSRAATPATSRISAAQPATVRPADPSVTTSTAPAAPSTTASAVVRTWTVAGGSLSVSCQGQAISLVYASPRDGWRVETERADDVVEVAFERVGQGIEVRAVCTGGIPSQTSQATQGDH
jgi:cytoskeletal protein RodZ